MSEDLIEVRKNKVAELKNRDVNPYAGRYEVRQTVREAMAFDDEAEAQTAGRIMASRGFGKLVFATIQDRSGRGQISFQKKNFTPEQWWSIQKGLDIGDLIGVSGGMWTTQKGEKTLEVKELTFLSKGLRPLPEKWHGLKDKEATYRQRYLSLVMDEQARDDFYVRSRVISMIRRFLDEHGILEVETPI
mgnify:CR=1 FL=1